ncbi:MAG: nucleotidyltransferase domain-containing protein [Cyanobacteria bacterium J06621_3]
MVSLPITWPTAKIEVFCNQWLVSELSLFGSVLRSDFHSDSDIDILIAFRPDSDWSLFDHVRMQQTLSTLLNRKVDLVSKRAIERSRNPIRKKNILSTAQVIYSQNAYAS